MLRVQRFAQGFDILYEIERAVLAQIGMRPEGRQTGGWVLGHHKVPRGGFACQRVRSSCASLIQEDNSAVGAHGR